MKHHLLALCLIALQSAVAEDMQKYLQQTQSLQEEGKHQEALDRHLWFHDHALEHDEAMYGVRLSFALSSWQDLGKKYPPAAKALEETRDRKAAILKEGKGSKETFHDVMAIDRTLEKPADTIRLFEEVGEKHPEKAAEYWRFVKDSVLDEKRFDVAKKYIKDIPGAFAEMVKTFEANKRLYTDPQAGGPRLQSYNERRFARDSLQLIDFALAIGDRPAAIEVQKKALSLVADPQVAGAVDP